MIDYYFAPDDYWKARALNTERALTDLCAMLSQQLPMIAPHVDNILNRMHGTNQQLRDHESARLLTGVTPAFKRHCEIAQVVGLPVPESTPPLPHYEDEEALNSERLRRMLRNSLPDSLCTGGSQYGGLALGSAENSDRPYLDSVLDGQEPPVTGFYVHRQETSRGVDKKWALLLKQDDQLLVVKLPNIHAEAYTYLPLDKVWIKHSPIGRSWNFLRLETSYHAMLLDQHNFLLPQAPTEEQLSVRFEDVFGDMTLNLDQLPDLDVDAPADGISRVVVPGESANAVVLLQHAGLFVVFYLTLEQGGQSTAKHWVTREHYLCKVKQPDNDSFHFKRTVIDPDPNTIVEWDSLLVYDQLAILNSLPNLRKEYQRRQAQGNTPT